MSPAPLGQTAAMDPIARRESSVASLSFHGISKSYGDTVAVDDLSLDVAAGEFFTLLGPSGSGKTTTLLMIAGFVTPTAGEIRINNRLMNHVPPDRRSIGIVFQNYALFPHMTIFDNVAFPLEMRGFGRRDIRAMTTDILALFRLSGQESKYPAQLSGGQQQRVAVARALVFHPSLLLMDEPLGALDKKLRSELQLELRHMQQSLGVTVVYVTHDQEEALTMSDRIAVMNLGRVEQVGTASELYEAPESLFVADFLGESNLFKGSIVEIHPSGFQVRLDRGESVSCPKGAGRVGDKVSVVIRPERVQLGTAENSPFNIPGRISDVVYLGSQTKYLVDASTIGMLLVCVNNDGVHETFSRGSDVFLGWREHDIRAFATNDPNLGSMADLSGEKAEC